MDGQGRRPIGILVKPNNPAGEVELRDAKAAARKLGLQLNVLTASSESDINAAFSMLLKRRAGASLSRYSCGLIRLLSNEVAAIRPSNIRIQLPALRAEADTER